MHHVVETTLTNIRSRYCNIKGRKIVKDILRKCVTCIRYQAATLKPPPTPDKKNSLLKRQANLYRKTKNEDKRNLVVGEIVIIRDDEPLPRHRWKMGRVAELIIGKDGNTRGARLNTMSTKLRTTCYRPLQKLIPLEIKSSLPTVNANIQPDGSKADDGDEIGQKHERKGRKAKTLGQYERRLRQRYL